jgi:colicin import membrane protein
VSEVKELAVVPPQETAMTVFSTENGLEPWLQKIRVEIDGFTPDVSSRKGREAIASMAYKVARSKTALDDVGKKLVADLKEIPKKIDAERKRVRDTLELWQEEVRQPLNEWQAAEDKRVDGHTDGIQRIKDMAVFTETPTATHVAQVIAALELVALDDTWEEFLPEAAQVKDKSLITLRALLVDRTKVEADLAAIAKFNAEQAIRDQQERDAEIARAAVEQAQRQAAEAAQAERDTAAKREQALIDQAAQAQRDADQKARDAEAAAANQALQLKLQAEQAACAAEQAEANRIAAEQRAEQQRVDAERRQAEAVEQARMAEIARQEAESAEAARQQAAREADKAHQIKIMGAAKEALMSMNITEELARAIVLKIARREVPHITINF